MNSSQVMDALGTRMRARYEAETDPVQREAYALAKRAGFDWYETESAARRMAEHAAEEILALHAQAQESQKALEKARDYLQGEFYAEALGVLDDAIKDSPDNQRRRSEPRIVINDKPLTEAQAMTVRVAIESFATTLADQGCGNDEHGKIMTEGYSARIDEIRRLIFG